VNSIRNLRFALASTSAVLRYQALKPGLTCGLNILEHSGKRPDGNHHESGILGRISTVEHSDSYITAG